MCCDSREDAADQAPDDSESCPIRVCVCIRECMYVYLSMCVSASVTLCFGIHSMYRRVPEGQTDAARASSGRVKLCHTVTEKSLRFSVSLRRCDPVIACWDTTDGAFPSSYRQKKRCVILPERSLLLLRAVSMAAHCTVSINHQLGIAMV